MNALDRSDDGTVTANHDLTGAISVTPAPPRRTADRTPRGPFPTCEQCGKKLVRVRKANRSLGTSRWTLLYRPGARYCSNACRQRAYRTRRKK